MKRMIILAAAVALLCAASLVMAEPAQVDYESMTIEEVRLLAEEANAYYKEQTTVASDKAKEARSLVTSALESMFPGQTIGAPMFGFDVKRERTVYTIDGDFTAKLEKQKTKHTVHATLIDDGGMTMIELDVDGSAAEIASQPGFVGNTDEERFNDYGEQLDLTVTDSTCVLKYRIEAKMTNKQTIAQNYHTVANFIRDGGGDQYDEVQYWAVAKMHDGSEGKVISFTVPKALIEKIKSGAVQAIDMGDYVDDLWILPSLQ